MNILVTGSAGFSGSHLVEELLSAGHRVRVLDDLSSGARENLPREVQASSMDTSIASCAAHDPPEGLDAIVHLAASPSVDFSWSHSLAAHENNLFRNSACYRVVQRTEDTAARPGQLSRCLWRLHRNSKRGR